MDRYSITPHVRRSTGQPIMMFAVVPSGEWVKYSDVEALQARVRELEGCLAHLYECHSYGGEINEDEHKRVMKQALQLITKGPHDER